MSSTDSDVEVLHPPPKLQRSAARGSQMFGHDEGEPDLAVRDDLRASPPRRKRTHQGRRGQGTSGKFRNWCFTINKSPDYYYDELKEEDLHQHVKFLIYQLEKGDETGRPHLQGYIEFTCQKTFDQVKEVLMCRHCHVEPAKASQEKNIEYCTKEEGRLKPPVERGERKRQGKRTDLDTVCDEIKSGRDLDEIAADHPVQFTKYHGGLRQLQTLLRRPRMRSAPNVYYLWGEPGCGKSRVAYALALELGNGREPYMAYDSKECWFDNYLGQKVVIFDDFSGNFQQQKMFNLLDFYPLQLPVKGSFTAIHADTFIFTSNMPPDECYVGLHHGAWRRRLGNIWPESRVQEEYKKRFAPAPAVGDADAPEPNFM